MNFQLYFHGQNTKTFDISSFDSSGLGPFKKTVFLVLIQVDCIRLDICDVVHLFLFVFVSMDVIVCHGHLILQ